MQLTLVLLLLFGVVVGWLLKHWLTKDQIAELRRQSQIGRVGTRSQRELGWNNSTSAEASLDSSSSKSFADGTSDQRSSNQPSSSSSIPTLTNKTHSMSSSSHAHSSAGGSLNTDANADSNNDLDELYQLAARVKPLEYDLRLKQKRIDELESNSAAVLHTRTANRSLSLLSTLRQAICKMIPSWMSCI